MCCFDQLKNPEFRTLATLRDALLPKLLSGELRVPFDDCETNTEAIASIK